MPLNSVIISTSKLGISFSLIYIDPKIRRVEGLSRELSIGVKFDDLRKSIERLQHVSIKLDDEKTRAEARFKKLLHKILKHGPCHQHRHWFTAQICKLLGLNHGRDRNPNVVSWKNIFHHISDGSDDISSRHHKRHWGKFVKAAKRVHEVNKKLIAFELGFISEDGIKDREWYRHLGVAPGKWLGDLGCTLYKNELLTVILPGYGATTFPALTESLAIDKNASMAQHEVGRLIQLIDKLRHDIHP
jgi:N-acetylated-alpha-linked acidic dipeptidase